MRKPTLIALGLLPLLALACENRTEKAIQKIGEDEETMRKVGATVNEVLRNASDCATAKPLMAEAYKEIDEAVRNVHAPATQQTLGALKSQVDRVAQACP